MVQSNVRQSFVDGQPSGVSNVKRDGAGKLVAWVENGFYLGVTYDSNGLPQVITAQGARGRLVQKLSFSGGVLVGVSGDDIPTAFSAILKQGASSGASAAVACPATIDATNAASLNGLTLNLAAGATVTVSDAAWALLTAGVSIQTAQDSGGTLAFSGTAVKENGSGTSAASVPLSACSTYALLPSPSGSPKFRLFVGGAL